MWLSPYCDVVLVVPHRFFNPLKRFSCGFLLVGGEEKRFLIFCCLLRVALLTYFFLLGFCFLICLIPDLRFAFRLALCVRLPGRGQKEAPEVKKKMSRGSKKDLGFATRCFGAEEKTAQNNA